MKNLISLILVLASTTSMAATGADMETAIIECQSVSSGPDHGLRLQVLTGGVAGLTRIETEEMWIGGVRTKSYIVSKRDLPPNQANNFVIYSSRQVALKIDITKADAQNRHPSAFNEKTKIGTRSTNLVCKINN